MEEWADNHDKAHTVIAQDEVGDVLVSTIFVGLAIQWGNRKPRMFETMIFGGIRDGYQQRYETYAEAEEGHAMALRMVKTGFRDPGWAEVFSS